MNNLYRVLISIFFLVAMECHAQSLPGQWGINAGQSYIHSPIDSVNMTTGNLVLHVPLLSYKQRGDLPDFTLELGYNNKSWLQETFPTYPEIGIQGCLDDWMDYDPPCSYTQWVWAGGVGVQVVRGNTLVTGALSYPDPYDEYSSDPTDFNVFTISDSSGASSTLYGAPVAPLYEWSPTLRTMDGTGVLCVNGPNGCTDNKGIFHTTSQDSFVDLPLSEGFADEWSDKHGNSVTASFDLYSEATSWTDSLGRTIPAPVHSTSYVQPIGCNTFQYPGQNGGTVPYRFCYQQIPIISNFGLSYIEDNSYTFPALSSVTLPNGTSYQFTYNSWGDLSAITLPSGGTISYQWESSPGIPLPSCNVPSCDYWERIITSRTLNANDGTPAKVWTYSGGVATDPLGNQTVYSGGGPGSDPTTVETHYQGLVSGGKMLESIVNCRKFQEGFPSGSDVFITDTGFIPGVTIGCGTTTTLSNGLVSAVTETYDPPTLFGDPLNQQGNRTASLSMGIPLSRTETDYGMGAPGPVIRTTNTTYQWQLNDAYKSANLLTLPATVTVLDGNGGTLAQSSYGYDENNGSPQGILGNQTSINKLVGVGLPTVKTTKVYNSQGMVTDTYDGNLNSGLPGNHVNIAYDSTGLYPYVITQSPTPRAQHVDYYGYDANTGNLNWHTDQNGTTPRDPNHSTFFTYDSSGRLIQTQYPDGGNVQVNYNGDPTPAKVTATTALAIGSTPKVVTQLYDGFGQSTQTQTNDLEGTIYQDTGYDSKGQVAFVSNPYRNTSDTTFGYTSFAYDALGRKTLQCQPDNGTGNSPCVPGKSYLQWTYTENIIASYDENGNKWTQTSDALGRLLSVTEPGNLTTSYTYDGNSNLLSVNQAGNAAVGESPRLRSFSYDMLSRLITSQNPETGTICYGLWSNGTCSGGYDANGNVLYKTDARGIVTSYSYDALSRLTSKSYSDGTISQRYSYDGLDEFGNPVGGPHANTIGRLTHTSNEVNVAATYSYDAMGRMAIKSECSPQSCYHTESAQYDLTGRMTSMTYPDGRTVSMSGDSSGRVTSVDYTSWGATAMNSNYLAVNPNGYDAAGNLKSATLGNGVGVTSDYDSRLRIKDLSYQSVNGPLWSKQFAWTGNGNLQTQTDQITQTQRQFGYDSLNRLTSAVDVIGGTSSGSAPTNTAAAPTSTVANSLAGGGADLSSWVATNASIAPTSIQAPDGTATAALVTANNGSPDSWVVRPLSNPSLYDQQSVTFSVWLRSPTGPQTVSLFIVEVGDDGFAVPAGKPVTLTSAWQSFQVTANTQNGLTTLICQIGGAGSFTSNQAVQVWGPQLVPSPGNVPSVTNSLLYSQRFTAPGWGSYYASVTDNADTAPDGTNTAALVVANPNSVDSYITAAIPNPIPQANTPVTASVYLRVTSGTQNLKLFLVGTGSGYSIPGSTVANLTTSWQRFTVSDSNSDPLGVLSFQIGGGNTLTNGQSIEVWGAQMELSPVAGQYVATAGAPVTQGSNLTNILPYSQKMDTWVAPNAGVAVVPNSVQAPDGSNTGATLTGSGSDSYMYGSVINPSLYSSASMTASVYLRVPSGTASVNVYLISIGDAGWSITSSIAANLTTNWQRFSLTGVTQNGLTQLSLQIGGGSSFTNGMVIQAWGGQMELASAAGPYVATDTIPVTSGKEYANILPNSTQLGGPNWGIANGSVVMNAVTAPDGSLTGASFTANAGSPDTYAINFNVTPALYDGETVTASVYLRVPSGTATMHVVLLDSSGSSYNSVATLNASLNTSWQRFDVTGTLDNGLQQLSMLIGSGGSFTSGTVDVWGPQIVQASSPGSYTPTPGSVQTANGSTASVAPGGLSQNFTYDSFGNIQQTGTVNFTAAYTPENRVSGFLYDAAGNMLSNGLSGMLVYNGENQVSQANGAVYTYDADGNRVETQGVTVTDTAYFNGMPIARYASGQWTDLIYGPTGLIAEVPGTQNGSPVYRMKDHLGTVVGTLDYQGNVLSLADYAPFGQLIAGGTNDPFVFTGKERDTESGLDNFGARYFGSSMGRFMSPDWSEQPDTVPYAEFENPQTLNLYSYGRNSPLVYNDPDGHDVNICDNNGNCHQVTNEQYQAAQQGNNGGLNVPTLDQVGSNGNGSGQFNSTAITDSSGNTVGTATYVSNGNLDYYANANGYQQLATASRVVKTGTAIYAGLVAGAFAAPEAAALGQAALMGARLKAGMVIGGFVMSAHAVEQAEARGVTPEEIEDAVAGVAKGNPQNGWDSVQRFYTSTCEVRVNKITGVIVTVISKISR